MSIVLNSCVLSMILALAACNSGGISEIEESLDNIKNFFQEPNTEPIRATVKTSIPLGNIAAISMAANFVATNFSELYFDLNLP